MGAYTNTLTALLLSIALTSGATAETIYGTTPKPIIETPLQAHNRTMVLFYACNEGPGFRVLRDIASGYDLSPDPLSSIDISQRWSTQSRRLTVHINPSVMTGQFKVKMPSTTYTAHTIFWYGIINSTDSNPRYLLSQNNSGSTPGRGYGGDQFYVRSSRIYLLAGEQASFRTTWAGSASSITTGLPVLLVMSCANGAYRFYNNSSTVFGTSNDAVAPPFFGGGQELDAFNYNGPLNSTHMPDIYPFFFGVDGRAWGDSDVSAVLADPWGYFFGGGTAKGYSLLLKPTNIVNEAQPVVIRPIPPGSSFGASPPSVTLASTGGESNLVIPLSSNGATATWMPTSVGTKIITPTNSGSLTNPAALSMTTRGIANPTGSSHTAPSPGISFPAGAKPPSGTSQWLTPIPSGYQPHCIFMTGTAISFRLPGEYLSAANGTIRPSHCTGWYIVRQHDGVLMDSGTMADVTGTTIFTLTSNVRYAQGDYKLYLTKGSASPTTGDWAGARNFSVWDGDPNLLNPTGVWCLYRDTSQMDVPADVLAAAPAFQQDISPFNAYSAPSGQYVYVKMNGTVRALTTGRYTVSYGDGVQNPLVVKVDGTVVYDKYDPNWPDALATAMNWSAGSTHNIAVECYVAQGTAQPSLMIYGPRGALPASQFTGEGGTSGTLTVRRYNGYSSQFAGGINDVVLHAMIRGGLIRYTVDHTRIPYSSSNLSYDLAADRKYRLGKDPARPDFVVVEFSEFGGATSAAQVTRFLSDMLAANPTLNLANVIAEPTNEPNGSYTGGNWAARQHSFWAAVRAANSSIKVGGPGCVTFTGSSNGGTPWMTNYFVQEHAAYGSATGDQDLLTAHAYNAGNGDLNWTQTEITNYKSNNTANGASSLNSRMFQTEQGWESANRGVYHPKHASQFALLQKHLYEANGIPNERSHYWYDHSHGFWEFPMFRENSDGTINPNATSDRVWGKETFGKAFASRYTFTGNKQNYMLGTLHGPDGSGARVAVFQTVGDPDGYVLLNVSGSSILQTVDSDGVVCNRPVVNGQVVVSVDDRLTYVRLPRGVNLSLPSDNWGPNLSLSAAATESGGLAGSKVNLTNDGIYQVDPTRTPEFGGVVYGQYQNSNLYDPWVEHAWASFQTFNTILVHCQPQYGAGGSLLDVEIQTSPDGSTWTSQGRWVETITHVTAYSPAIHCSIDDYSRRRFAFKLHLKRPVAAKAYRVIVHLATKGGETTALSLSYGGQGWGVTGLGSPWPVPYIEEIEAYDAPISVWGDANNARVGPVILTLTGINTSYQNAAGQQFRFSATNDAAWISEVAGAFENQRKVTFNAGSRPGIVTLTGPNREKWTVSCATGKPVGLGPAAAPPRSSDVSTPN